MICSIFKDKYWSNKCNVVMFKATHPPIIHHHITLFTKILMALKLRSILCCIYTVKMIFPDHSDNRKVVDNAENYLNMQF